MDGVDRVEEHGLVAGGKVLVRVVAFKELVGGVVVSESQDSLRQAHGRLKGIMRPEARMTTRLLINLDMLVEAGLQGLSSRSVEVRIENAVVLIKNNLVYIEGLVFVKSLNGSSNIVPLLEKEPVILHVNPVFRFDLLELVPDDIHALAMPPLLGPLHVVFKERKGVGHDLAVLLRGIVVHTEEEPNILYVCPASQYGVHRLFEQVPALTGRDREHYFRIVLAFVGERNVHRRVEEGVVFNGGT
jgi:hypothetical protein